MDAMAAADRVGAAKRRRDRQLRAFRRHELLTVRMELAAALHHSAQRVEEPREGEVHEEHDGQRVQKRPLPGMLVPCTQVRLRNSVLVLITGQTPSTVKERIRTTTTTTITTTTTTTTTTQALRFTSVACLGGLFCIPVG